MQQTINYLPERLEQLLPLIDTARGLCEKSCVTFATCAKLSQTGETTIEEGLRKNLHDSGLAIRKALSLAQSTAVEAEPLEDGLDSLLKATAYSLEASLLTGFTIGASGTSIDALRKAQGDTREINARYPIITSAFVARGLLLSFARQSVLSALSRYRPAEHAERPEHHSSANLPELGTSRTRPR